MRYYLKYIIIVFVFLMSCTEVEKNVLPDDLIERDRMVEIISEVELTQALIKLKFTTQDTLNSQKLYDQVFEEFEITEEQFNKSLAYYCKTPKGTEQIYFDGIEKLSEKQIRLK